jgi:opacity protein-like surface antigen
MDAWHMWCNVGRQPRKVAMKNFSFVLIACVGGGLATTTATAHAQAIPQPGDPVPRDPGDPIPEPTDPPTPPDPSPGAPRDPAEPTSTEVPADDDATPPTDPMPPDDTPIVVEHNEVDLNVQNVQVKDPDGDRVGVMLLVGGGVVDFADETMRERTQAGGLWDVRAVLGTRAGLGVEAGYRGTAQAIDALGLDSDAMLLGTTFEAVGRVNLAPREQINPYLFGGAAWTRYSLTNNDSNTSDVTAHDDMLEVPVGLGLGYRVNGFVTDVRGELRMVNGDDLVADDNDDGTLELHTWSASARLGYEF